MFSEEITTMHDRYNTFSTGLESPVIDGFAITPDDHEYLPETTRAVYVGGAGSLSVTLASGAVITLEGIGSGTFLPLRACRVLATDTTATAIIGLV